MPSGTTPDTGDFSEKLVSMSKRRGFYWPSFEIYGGVAGFYDYGPLGLMLRDNIAGIWRKKLRAEGFYEIDTPHINPESVFRSSGHLDFFSDYLVDCMKCRESFRADHLVDLGGELSNPATLTRKIEEQKVRCPRCGGKDFSPPRPFNLMFRTQIGPSAGKDAYLRPETAQGIFVNYQQLSRFFREKLPFGVMQRGRGYRNEISPRQGMLRLRELNMMEAELFIDPSQKRWRNFAGIIDEELTLVPSNGAEGKYSVGRAVKEGIIGTEVLAYFMHLTHSIMTVVGVDPDRSRFRQHLKDEMAHYSSETWDFEARLNSGWTELAGIAYRGDYDLGAHIKGSAADLRYFRKSGSETVHHRSILRPNRAKLGPVYKKNAKEIASLLEEMNPEDAKGKKFVRLKIGGKNVDVPSEFFSVVEIEEKVRGEKIVPHVVEPSMGLDRMFITVLEHSYRERDGYAVLSLPAAIAPIKAGVFPLLQGGELERAALEVYRKLLDADIEVYYDDSGSIGRRYARMDEVGTPYCITVDELTAKSGTVTIRERDSRKQIRVGQESLREVIGRMLEGEPLSVFGKPVESREEPVAENEGF